MPLLSILLFCCLFTTKAQKNTVALPSVQLFEETPDTSVYKVMQNLISANWNIQYVSPMLLRFVPLQPRRQGGLRFGEGQNGYILEGVTDMQFPIAQGRSSANHFWQTLRINLRYAPAVRMTKDNSSNLLPTNQKIGFQIDKVLWDNATGNNLFKHTNFAYDLSRQNWPAKKKPLKMLYFTGVAMHYSNGQPEGVWLDNNAALNRNDYIKGDFSTNIMHANFTYTRLSQSVFSVNMGYQRDANWFGPFYFIEEQRYRYGQHRLTGYIQYITAPKKNPFGATMSYRNYENDSVYCIDRKWEWKLRYEWEYIMGSLRNYPFKNGGQYRYNSHLYIEGMPLRSRSVGYLLHLYYGRDYFNIRYDDPVFGIMAGISLKLHRFKNPLYNFNNTVLGISNNQPADEKYYKKRKEKSTSKTNQHN